MGSSAFGVFSGASGKPISDVTPYHKTAALRVKAVRKADHIGVLVHWQKQLRLLPEEPATECRKGER